MTYDYFCDRCQRAFDVIKPMSDSGRDEPCYVCGDIARRLFTANITIIGSRVENAEYNPAFGMVIKSKRHLADEAKARGMIEIGNEPVDSIHKQVESTLESNIKKYEDDV